VQKKDGKKVQRW
jgi:hypothetical protein